MMIEPGSSEFWAYKRDPSFKRPRTEMVMRTADEIPYLNPSAVLLFKARDRRPKDRQDFERALPKLSVIDRAWLKDCLDVLHPGNDGRERCKARQGSRGIRSARAASVKFVKPRCVV